MPPQNSVSTLSGGMPNNSPKTRSECRGEAAGQGRLLAQGPGRQHSWALCVQDAAHVCRRTQKHDRCGENNTTGEARSRVRGVPPHDSLQIHVRLSLLNIKHPGEETSKQALGRAVRTGPRLALSTHDRTRLPRPRGPEQARPQSRRRTAAPLHGPGWPDRKPSPAQD